jgi:hypothetical protein
MVGHACNASTWEAEAGGLQVWVSQGSKSQKQTNKKLALKSSPETFVKVSNLSLARYLRRYF